jgi:hypothetical protein
LYACVSHSLCDTPQATTATKAHATSHITSSLRHTRLALALPDLHIETRLDALYIVARLAALYHGVSSPAVERAVEAYEDVLGEAERVKYADAPSLYSLEPRTWE